MIYLGCSQWHYDFWKGELFPEGSKPGDYLKYYSDKFTTVELNSTYYEIKNKKIVSGWKTKVNKDFRFCPKFSKAISHDRRLSRVEALADEFIKSVSELKENLGICYLQLPPLFLHSELHLIDELLSYINHRIKVSVEIRPEWLARPEFLDESFSIFKEHKAGIVMVDSVETIKHLNNYKLTNSTAFIRFLSYNHSTDFDRLNDWVNLIKLWQDKGIEEVFFMLHFADGVRQPDIVDYAIEKFDCL